MISYHGTPITPRSELERLVGRHFCVSFADPRDIDWCLAKGSSVMMDNGAFSMWTRRVEVDWNKFYDWVRPRLRHPHWVVLPDVIDGDEAANDALLKSNPFPRELVAPVWHMHESLDRLSNLAQDWPKVCIGSSGDYNVLGSPTWCGRIDAAWETLDKLQVKPWVHMLRAMATVSKGRWPFASADSTNIARNHKGSSKQRAQDICEMADRLDSTNPKTPSYEGVP
jgi:hypothetical protein